MIKKPFKKLHNRAVKHGHEAVASMRAMDSRIPTKWYKRWVWYANPKRFRDFWFTKAGARTAMRLAGIWTLTGFALLVGLFLFFAKDLPNPNEINSKLLEQTTQFYDRTGEKVIYEVHGDKNRTSVDLDQISEHLKNATVAVEDKNFYRHGAFSSLGILRAAVNNVLNRDSIQGGSTITQQYVKNALLSPERTFTRKVKELILSMQIEWSYSKEDILKLYLNEIPYGAQAYGAQAAAKTYFNKDASDLTPDEAAMLAALPRAPTYYSPYGDNVDELLTRQDLILDLMHEQGYIDEKTLTNAKKADTYAKVNDVPNLYANVTAPHFVLHAQNVLSQEFGERQVSEAGYKVITTLDLKLQKKAEKAVKDGIGVVDSSGGNNAALVAGDPNSGQILAMVGSRNFNHPGYGAYNAATARRQPGSSFKPYVYAAGFKTNKWGPGSIMYDVRTDFGGGYTPNNYDNRFHGANTIRWHLGNSFNIPAVKMLYIAGMEEAFDTVHSMGITTLENPEDYGLSLVLGAGEVKLIDHVNGYETFANGGLHYAQTPILKVTDQKGNVVQDNTKPEGKRVLDPQIPYLITDILSDPNARAITFSSAAGYMTVPNQDVFVKTGTTDDNRDGWMIGGSRHIVGGVWVGRSDNGPMYGITSTMTGAIWGPFMDSAHEGKKRLDFERPSGIKSVTLDRYTGKLPSSGSKSTITDIFPSWYQPGPSGGIKEAIIDTVSKKLATNCTPEAARKKITGIGLQAEIPPEDPAYGRWNPPVQALAASLGFSQGGVIPTEKDDVHKCSDKKPNVTLSTKQTGNSIEVTADVKAGTHPLAKLTISVKGKTIFSKAISKDGAYKTTYQPPSDGDYTFTATVSDKALYEGTNSVNHNYTGGDGEGPGVLNTGQPATLANRRRIS